MNSATIYSIQPSLSLMGSSITYLTSGLRYERESGALNESFSDMLGVSVGFATNDGDWLMGDNTNVFGNNGNALRNLADPPSQPNPFTGQRQPDTYGGQYWYNVTNCTPDQFNDSCGVHINSGVPNKMFYLFAAPGSHNHNGITVNGIGVDSAMKTMYLSNKFYWAYDSDFKDAMYGSLYAAEEFDANGIYGTKYRELLKAWEAVKVCVPNGNVDGFGSTPNEDDVLALLYFVFIGISADYCASDINCDGTYSASDVVGLLRMVFLLGGTLCPYTS